MATNGTFLVENAASQSITGYVSFKEREDQKITFKNLNPGGTKEFLAIRKE